MTREIAPTLENDIVRLEPLTLAHEPGVREAAGGERESFGYAQVPTPGGSASYIAEMLSRERAGACWPYAQVEVASGRVVGHTSYLSPRWWPGDERLLAIEIGSTWLHSSAQGTAINSAAKLLLLAHAFEALGVSRVDIKTDARNARARAGILALGATFEGVLRNWQHSAAPGEDGLTRDTAMHSITAGEWPERKAALEARVAAKRGR